MSSHFRELIARGSKSALRMCNGPFFFFLCPSHRLSHTSWAVVSTTEYAYKGATVVGFSGWAVLTAAIILYLPLERALEADARFHETNSQLMGAMPGSGGGGGGSAPAIFTGGQ